MVTTKICSYDEDSQILTNAQGLLEKEFNVSFDMSEGYEKWGNEIYLYPFIWSEDEKLDCTIKVGRFENFEGVKGTTTLLIIAFGEEGEIEYYSKPNDLIETITQIINEEI